jgi:hypothetical protein
MRFKKVYFAQNLVKRYIVSGQQISYGSIVCTYVFSLKYSFKEITGIIYRVTYELRSIYFYTVKRGEESAVGFSRYTTDTVFRVFYCCVFCILLVITENSANYSKFYVTELDEISPNSIIFGVRKN